MALPIKCSLAPLPPLAFALVGITMIAHVHIRQTLEVFELTARVKDMDVAAYGPNGKNCANGDIFDDAEVEAVARHVEEHTDRAMADRLLQRLPVPVRAGWLK